MARPREFDPDKALQTAIDLFWEKGYYDSSVDEVVKRSGVAKYGIYGTFGPKKALFRKALLKYASQRNEVIQDFLCKPDSSLDAIKEFFKAVPRLATQDKDKAGCLVINAGIELGLRDPEIRDFVRDFFRDLARVFQRCLDRAVEKGEIDASKDVARLATFLTTEFRTALMLARSGHPRQEIERHLELALEVLQ